MIPLFDLPASQGFRAGGTAARLRSILEGARRPLAAKLNAKYPSMWWSGAELGLLAFAANAVMVSPSRWPDHDVILPDGTRAPVLAFSADAVVCESTCQEVFRLSVLSLCWKFWIRSRQKSSQELAAMCSICVFRCSATR